MIYLAAPKQCSPPIARYSHWAAIAINRQLSFTPISEAHALFLAV